MPTDRSEQAGARRQLLEDIVKSASISSSSLTALVVAAGRMLDGWAEGDADVKRHLWQQLHGMAEEADQRHGIYPL